MKAALFCWFFLLVLSRAGLNAQSFLPKHQYMYLSVSGNYGYLAPHHKSIKYFVKDHVTGFQIEGGIKTSGDKKWHLDYNFPKTGIGYYSSTLGNDAVFGQSRALYGFFQTENQYPAKKIYLFQKFSFGISHLSEKYNLYENPYNLAISTNLNVYLAYMAGLNIEINKEMAIHTGVTFNHFSNGKVKEPNKGLNTVTISTALTYKFNHTLNNKQLIPQKKTEYYPNRWMVSYAMGWKQLSRRVDEYFPAASLALDYAFFSRPTKRLGAGIDLFYDSSAEAHRAFDSEIMASEWEFFRTGIHFSYEFLIGRSSFIVQPGVYFFNPYNKYGYGYNRLGFRYRLTPHLVSSVGIKAHFPAKADFIEWGLGYAF